MDPDFKRTEQWFNEDEAILVEVNVLNETVVCSYQAIAQMLTNLGYVKE